MATAETNKTTKNLKLVEGFLYYFKSPINKDGTSRYVCSESSCSASITMFNDEIIKINGKIIEACTSELIRSSHKDGHDSLEKSQIFNIDFRVIL
jgi:hypothetical protein